MTSSSLRSKGYDEGRIKPFPELYTLFRQCGFEHKEDYLMIDKSETNKNKSLTVQNLIQLFMSSYQAI